MDELEADDQPWMEWLCPITQELPTDPVTACDGRVYERSAIVKWFAERDASGESAISPLTGLTMSTELMPAVQVRNMITRMVKHRQIVGEHADAWLAAMKQAETDRKQKAKGPPTPAPAALNPWEVCKRKLGRLMEAHREGLITDEDYRMCEVKFLNELNAAMKTWVLQVNVHNPRLNSMRQ